MVKKFFKIILIVLVVLTVAAGSLAIWQRKNIASIVVGIKETDREIERRRNENQSQLVSEVSSQLENPLRDMTEEEKQEVDKGNMTIVDVYSKIFEERKQELERSKGSTSSSNISQKIEDKPTKDEIITKYMAQLYKLQNEFTAKAEATIAQGASYYEKLKKHPQDAEARASTITHFTPIVRGIESECNKKVDTAIANLKKELEEIGAETDIIGTIKATYENEKQLKLSFYANKYLK